MLSDVFSSAARYHDGHEQRYNFQFYVLSFHTDSYPQLFKCKSLRFVLTLTYCSNRYRYSGYWLHGLNKRIRFYHMHNDGADGSDWIWKPNRICVQCEQRLSAEGNWEVLSLVSLHLAEVRHSGHVSPWWKKPNDAGQLSTEETLRLCVRVLQMKSPKKQELRAVVEWILHSCLKLDKTLEFPQWKGLLSPLTGLQWGRAPTHSSPDSHHHPLYNTWLWLCAEGERMTILIASTLRRLARWRWLLSSLRRSTQMSWSPNMAYKRDTVTRPNRCCQILRLNLKLLHF